MQQDNDIGRASVYGVSALGSGTMNSGNRNKAESCERRPVSRVLFAAALSALLLLVPVTNSLAQRARPAPPPPMRQAPAARPNANQNNRNNDGHPAANGTYRPGADRPGQTRPGTNGPYQTSPAMNAYRPAPGAAMRSGANGARPGLQGWVARHQNMTPAQQENLLRSEPGFNRLSPDQQHQLLDRFRTFTARPPVQQARTAGRLEIFQRLSPEQKQDVRSSTASLAAMPADRRMLISRAFNDLRQLPPEQRQQILNSARFSQQFSPQERHVLGSVLSIEPYQP